MNRRTMLRRFGVGLTLTGAAATVGTVPAGAAPGSAAVVPGCVKGANQPQNEVSFNNGVIVIGFSVAAASCPGATYTAAITLDPPLAVDAGGWSGTGLSYSGDPLGLTQPNYNAPQPTSPTFSASASGQTVTFAFTGDGATQSFIIRGAPAGAQSGSCVEVSVSTAVGTVQFDKSGSVSACDNGGAGGGGFW